MPAWTLVDCKIFNEQALSWSQLYLSRLKTGNTLQPINKVTVTQHLIQYEALYDCVLHNHKNSSIALFYLGESNRIEFIHIIIQYSRTSYLFIY